MYKTGDKPGKGLYRCANCSEIIWLYYDTDALPACPKCGGECCFNKVG